MPAAPVGPVFKGWALGNERLVAAIRPLTTEQLALVTGTPPAPLWGTVAHLAGGRVYWLCEIFKEPGKETTPFRDMDVALGGWEDDPSHPRSAAELVEALETSWRLVARVLDEWTLDTLGQEARVVRADGTAVLHTRQSVLYRMLTHDAYHIGEIALVLGSNGLRGEMPNGPVDLWAGLGRIAS